MRKFYWWETELKENQKKKIVNPTPDTPADTKPSPEYKKVEKENKELKTKIEEHHSKQKKIIDDALDKSGGETSLNKKAKKKYE